MVSIIDLHPHLAMLPYPIQFQPDFRLSLRKHQTSYIPVYFLHVKTRGGINKRNYST